MAEHEEEDDNTGGKATVVGKNSVLGFIGKAFTDSCVFSLLYSDLVFCINER